MEKQRWTKLFEKKKLSSRERILESLKEAAKTNWDAKELLTVLEDELGEVFLKNPEEATKYQINSYNELVVSSELPLAERKKFLME